MALPSAQSSNKKPLDATEALLASARGSGGGKSDASKPKKVVGRGVGKSSRSDAPVQASEDPNGAATSSEELLLPGAPSRWNSRYTQSRDSSESAELSQVYVHAKMEKSSSNASDVMNYYHLQYLAPRPFLSDAAFVDVPSFPVLVTLHGAKTTARAQVICE